MRSILTSTILIGKPEKKKAFGIPGHKSEDNNAIMGLSRLLHVSSV
jgi:hypothetical protein